LTKKSQSEEWGQGLVAHTYNPNYSGGRDQEDHDLRAFQAKGETLSQRYTTQKRAGRVAQVVQPLPSKHEALT
jgi:hypothetical protein